MDPLQQIPLLDSDRAHQVEDPLQEWCKQVPGLRNPRAEVQVLDYKDQLWVWVDPVSQVRVLDLREDSREEVDLLALDRLLVFLRVDLQGLRRRAFSLRPVVEDSLLGLVALAGSEIGGVGEGGGGDEDSTAGEEWHRQARALPEKQGAGAAQNTPNFWM